MRRLKEVTNEEYFSFYESLTNEGGYPLFVKRFCTEGQMEFRALIYVPPSAPSDLFDYKRSTTISSFTCTVLSSTTEKLWQGGYTL